MGLPCSKSVRRSRKQKMNFVDGTKNGLEIFRQKLGEMGSSRANPEGRTYPGEFGKGS